MNCSVRYSFLIIFICLVARLPAQELIINGSFEDINVCAEVGAKCSPAAWFFVNAYGPRGYVHRHPNSAASGKEYLDIMVAENQTNNRTYWQTMLSCRLVRGAEYQVSFNVAADNVGPNLNDIGILFSDQFIYSRRDTVLQPESYLGFHDANTKKLKNYWFRVSKTFVATSEYQVLLIGNFSSASNEEIIRARKFKGDFLNINLDDVSVKMIAKTICTETVKTRDSLYAITARHTDLNAPVATAGLEKSSLAVQPDPLPKTDTIRLASLLFEYDSHILKDTSSLSKYRQVLSSRLISSITISGFADDRGSEAYNKALSLRRADEIKNLLAMMFDIPQSIIKTTSEGRSDTFTDRNLNRRVEIYVYY